MNQEATIAYLEQRLTQLSVENDGLKQELRRLKPQTVVNPKGKLVQLKQVSDMERMNLIYVINLVAALPSFVHNNLAPWVKLLDYHRILEKSGQIDVNITVEHFQPKYISDEIFSKPTTKSANKKVGPKLKKKPKAFALVKK